MRILVCDVAIKGCSVGCFDDSNGIAVQRRIDTERGQAEMLIPLIDEVVRSAGWERSWIDRIAVTTGPGSFTGVRIGLATARHLGMALDRPVMGFSTFAVVRAGCDNPAALILFDTQRGDYYGETSEGARHIWSAEDVETYSDLTVKDALPDLAVMARLAVQADVSSHYEADQAPVPVYLRGAEVSLPKKNPRVFSSAS